MVKNQLTNAGDICSIPGSGRYSGEGDVNPLQCSSLGKSHGQRSLEGYSPWGCKELDTADQLTMHAQWLVKLNIFHMPVGHLYVFFWEVSIHIFCPSFNRVIWVFSTELFMFLIYLGVLTLIRNMVCKYFILFHGLHFHSIDCFLCWAETFWFDEITLVSFWFYCLCFWCGFQNDSVEAFLLHFLLVVLWLQVLHLSL